MLKSLMFVFVFITIAYTTLVFVPISAVTYVLKTILILHIIFMIFLHFKRKYIYTPSLKLYLAFSCFCILIICSLIYLNGTYKYILQDYAKTMDTTTLYKFHEYQDTPGNLVSVLVALEQNNVWVRGIERNENISVSHSSYLVNGNMFVIYDLNKNQIGTAYSKLSVLYNCLEYLNMQYNLHLSPQTVWHFSATASEIYIYVGRNIYVVSILVDVDALSFELRSQTLIDIRMKKDT